MDLRQRLLKLPREFASSGKDATIKFFFDRDYLKAGGVTNDGAIDFKDRGEMPFVESGTILAEKTAIKESRNGKNIYGGNN